MKICSRFCDFVAVDTGIIEGLTRRLCNADVGIVAIEASHIAFFEALAFFHSMSVRSHDELRFIAVVFGQKYIHDFMHKHRRFEVVEVFVVLQDCNPLKVTAFAEIDLQ